MLRESQALASELSILAESLVEGAEASAKVAAESTRSALGRGEFFLLGIAGLSLVAVFLIAWFTVHRGIVRRLTGLASTMLAIAEGDLDAVFATEWNLSFLTPDKEWVTLQDWSKVDAGS